MITDYVNIAQGRSDIGNLQPKDPAKWLLT